MVLAIGADTNYFGNQNIKRHATPMKSLGEAIDLRNTILTNFEKALNETDEKAIDSLLNFVIVGGGPTGTELAGALAEMKKYILPKDYPELDNEEVDIYLVQSGNRLLKGMSDEAAEKALEYLKKLGVKVMLDNRVVNVDENFVFLKDGTTIRSRKVIWAAGITGNKIEGLPDDCMVRGNRLKVNEFNQIECFDNVYAIGDIAYMEGAEYPRGHPQVAQVAIQQGKHLAKNFKNLSKGKTLIPFKYKDLGSMATIGRNLAVVDLPRFKTQGSFAWLVWLFVHLFSLIGIRNKVIVFINWVWNYFTYDQSLRLIIKVKERNGKKV